MCIKSTIRQAVSQIAVNLPSNGGFLNGDYHTKTKDAAHMTSSACGNGSSLFEVQGIGTAVIIVVGEPYPLYDAAIVGARRSAGSNKSLATIPCQNNQGGFRIGVTDRILDIEGSVVSGLMMARRRDVAHGCRCRLEAIGLDAT